MKAIKPCPDRFSQLQTRAQSSAREARDYRIGLHVKYGGSVHWASRGERSRLEQLDRRASKDCDRLHAYVSAISPRDWTQGIPSRWVVDCLTYADAVTRGPLSRVPDPAWGYTEAYARQFAQEVRADVA
jgi:hypothetical protein